MYVSRKLAVNSIVLFGVRAFGALLSLVVSIFLIRYLGGEGYGKFSIVFAYLSFFQILTGSSVDTIVTKEISRGQSRQDVLVNSALVLRAAMSAFAIFGSWLALQFMGYAADVKWFIFIASFSLMFNLQSLYVALFQAHHDVTSYAIPELIVGILSSLLIAVLIFAKANLYAFIFLQAGSLVLLLPAYMFVAGKRFQLKLVFRVDRSVCRKLVNDSWPIFISAVFVAITMRLDQVFIFRILGAESLGFYSAVVKLTESLRLIPTVYMVAVFPIMCASFGSSPDYFIKTYRLSLKYMSIFIVPAAFGTAMLSTKIITVFYGPAFHPASGALAVLIFAEIFSFLGLVFGSTLYAAGLQRDVLIFTGLGALANIVLNTILIPRYGILGAAIASLNSYGGILLMTQYLKKSLRRYMEDYLKALVVPFLCSLPMSAFLYAFPHWPMKALIPLSILIYVVFLFSARHIDGGDVEYARQIFLPGYGGSRNGEVGGPD